MHPCFLKFLFGRGAVKTLQELGESDHMDQFVCYDIGAQRKHPNMVVPFNGSANDVILKTNLEVISGLARTGPQMRRALVSPNLCKCNVYDLIVTKVLQALNVVSITLPFRGCDLIEITDEFL